MRTPAIQGRAASASPDGKHMAIGFTAVVVSALLHGVALEKLPPVPVGSLADAGVYEPMKPTELGDVRLDPGPSLESPPRFEPENPAAAAEAARRLDESAVLLEELMPDGPPEPGEIEVVGQATPLAPPDPQPPAPALSARQEIYQIEETLYADDVSALPRRYVPSVERVGAAPDITLPVDLTAVHTPSGAFPGIGSTAGTSANRPPVIMEPVFEVPLRESPAGLPLTEAENLKESSELANETPEEISPIEPVEQLLRLGVDTFRSGDDGYTYFRLAIRRAGAEALPVMARDVLYVLDSSQSMTQSKLERCKDGIRRGLERLGPNDRVNLVAFRDEVLWCFEDWQTYRGGAREGVDAFLTGLKAKGRTDVFGSLQSILRQPNRPGRPLLVVLVTDGRPTMGMVDSSDIIMNISRMNQGRLSVFALGGGTRVNRFLLDMLSHNNRGDSLVVREKEDIPPALDHWALQLSRPVLKDLRFRFSGLNETDIFPRTLTHLFLDRPLVLYGRVPDTDRAVAFRIVGDSGTTERDMVFPLELGGTSGGDEDIRDRWAWNKVYHLIGRHIESREEGVLQEIRLVADRFDIPVPYGGDIIPMSFY